MIKVTCYSYCKRRSCLYFNFVFNPACTKPIGTYTLYQGGRGSDGSPAISKTVLPMNMKFCIVLEKSLNVLEMLTFYIVINWLP